MRKTANDKFATYRGVRYLQTVKLNSLATFAVCTAIIVVWSFIALSLDQDITETQRSPLLLQYGAVTGENIDDGEYWKLVASQFTHVKFLHMLANVIFIFLLGRAIEKEFGAFVVTSVYLLSGTLGQFASVTSYPELVSSGASQALCGLAGFLLIFSKRLLTTHVTTFIILAAFVLIQVGLDLYFAGYLKAGHTVGLVSGILFGFLANLWSNPYLTRQ